jgi:hypothetical protein
MLVPVADGVAPLHHWLQIGKALEMRDQSNQYKSELQLNLRLALLGENEYGEPVVKPFFDPNTGFFLCLWNSTLKCECMDKGRNTPKGRT